MTVRTRDGISLRGAGIVNIVQPKKGFRFTLDSLLLADFCRIKPRDRILEPGCGTGIISLLLAKKFPNAHITSLEIQAASVELCRANIIDNDLQGRITVLEKDIGRIERVLTASFFDAVIANPPYTREGAGLRSPNAERQTARHDPGASLEEWLDLAAFLKNKGRYAVVFPAARTAELTSLMKKRNLEPKRLRPVYPHAGKPASLILMEAVKAAGPGLEILPPLVVHTPAGGYTNDMKEIYGLPFEA